MGHLRSEVSKRIDAISTLKAEIEWLLKYQRVRIVSNYNGQPYGRSKKPLTGEVRRITSIYLNEWEGPRITVFLEKARVGLRMEEIAFSDETESEKTA